MIHKIINEIQDVIGWKVQLNVIVYIVSTSFILLSHNGVKIVMKLNYNQFEIFERLAESFYDDIETSIITSNVCQKIVDF